jgi:hypothetical protein
MATSTNSTILTGDAGLLAAQRLTDASSWFTRLGLRELESAVAGLSPELDFLVWSHLAEGVPIEGAADDAGIPLGEADEHLQDALAAIARTLEQRGWGKLSNSNVAELLRIAGSLVSRIAEAEPRGAKPSAYLLDWLSSTIGSDSGNVQEGDNSEEGVEVREQLAAVAFSMGCGAKMETFSVAPDPVDPQSGYLQLVHAVEDYIVQVAEEVEEGADRHLRLVDSEGRTLEVPLNGLRDVRDAGVFAGPIRAAAADTAATVGGAVAEVEATKLSVMYELPFEHGRLVFAQRGGDLLFRIDTEKTERTS